MMQIGEAAKRVVRSPFGVGGPVLTPIFWTIVLAFVVTLWLSPVLPLGDYNYHLALSSVMRRMVSSSDHAQLYESNLFTYNAGFHIVVALLSFAMPTPYAGLVVLSAIWIGFSLATIALLRALGQPTDRAFIVFPLYLSLPMAWGFVNHMMALAIMLYALARTIRRPRARPVPFRYDLLTGTLALAALVSHLYATAVVYALVLVVIVVRTISDRDNILAAYLRSLDEGLTYLPVVVVAAAMYFNQRRLANKYAHTGWADSNAWQKVKVFYGSACDYYADGSDQRRLKIALGFLCLLLFIRLPKQRTRGPSTQAWLLAAVGAMYLLLPDATWGTFVLFERLAMLLALVFAVAVPRGPETVEKAVGIGLAGIGVWCAVAWADLRIAQLGDLRDLEAVVAAAPEGRMLGIHVTQTKLAKQRYAWAGQLAPYYVAARKGLGSAMSYADLPYSPARYRKDRAPPTAPDAVAWGTQAYDPKAPWAKHFDLVLVRTTEADPSAQLWPIAPGGAGVKLVAHRGQWWMFDAKPYFEHQ